LTDRGARRCGNRWRVGKSLGRGLVCPEYAEPGTTLEIEILGECKPITIVPESPHDTENKMLAGVRQRLTHVTPGQAKRQPRAV